MRACSKNIVCRIPEIFSTLILAFKSSCCWTSFNATFKFAYVSLGHHFVVLEFDYLASASLRLNVNPLFHAVLRLLFYGTDEPATLYFLLIFVLSSDFFHDLNVYSMLLLLL